MSKRASCSCQKLRVDRHRLRGSDWIADLRIFFNRTAETLAHLGGGGLGEGDDEQFVERRAFAVEAIEAAGDERLGLAGAGAGHDEDVAARFHGLPLGRRERIVLGARRFHVAKL